MRSTIVIEDGYGNGWSLHEWFQAHGCPSTIVRDYQDAFTAILNDQAAGSMVIMVFAPLLAESLEFAAAVHDRHPAVINGCYTTATDRSHDAALMQAHGLVAIMHQPFDGEHPAVVGLSPVAAPAARAPAPPPATGPLQAYRMIDDASPVAPSSPVAPAVPATPAHVSSGRDPTEHRNALWIVMVEDRPGCCKPLAEALDTRGVNVQVTESWVRATDLSLNALSPGLIIAPATSDGATLCRRLLQAGNGSQVVLYSESRSQAQDPVLAKTYGCLTIVHRAFDIDSMRSIVEWISAPGWRPPHREAPPVPSGRPAVDPQRSRSLRTPLPQAGPAASLPGAPARGGASPGTTRSTTRTTRPDVTAKPPQPPLSGIAAIRARKLSEPDKPAPRSDVTGTSGLAPRQQVVRCSGCGADILMPLGVMQGLCLACSRK